MFTTRLLVKIKSENVILTVGVEGSIHVCIVVTPLIVCQIQGNGYTHNHYKIPSVHPPADISYVCLCRRILQKVLVGLRLAFSFVDHLPVRLLTFLRLHFEWYIQGDTCACVSVR